MTFEKWKHSWRIFGKGRLGQTFCNQYLGNVYSGQLVQLFYEEDYWVANALIEQWLIDNCYYPNMPEPIFK